MTGAAADGCVCDVLVHARVSVKHSAASKNVARSCAHTQTCENPHINIYMRCVYICAVIACLVVT